MSSRALRRALKEREEEAEEPIEDTIIDQPKPKAKNLFALLNDSQSETESESDSEPSESESESEEEITPSNTTANSMQPVKQVKQRKQAIVTEDNFDELLKEYKVQEPSISSPSAINPTDPLCAALAIDGAWLDANVELKKKFGGAAVGGGNSAMSQINSRQLRNNPALAKAMKRKPFKRKNGFITPRPLWPPFGPGETELSVRKLAEPASFEIVESEVYQAWVQELLVMIQSGDLEFLMQLVQSCPLFIDGLLLMSDAYRMQSTGDAGEIVERAMYILERLLPGEACFLEGNVRFPYAKAGNRKLHLTLFRLCQFTIKQGCWRVALQQAKALLQLDPENDPLGARLLIEFLSLQSNSLGQFDCLYEELKACCKLPILPSWPLSRALRMFKEEREGGGDHSVSLDELVEAIKRVPGTVQLLATQLKVSLPSGFESLFAVSLKDFEGDLAGVAASKIFVSRCEVLWKDPEVTAWLRSGLNRVVLQQEGGVLPTISVSAAPMSAQVAIYRHALLSDLPALKVSFPPSLSSQLNSFDPCPPEYYESDAVGGILGRLRQLFF